MIPFMMDVGEDGEQKSRTRTTLALRWEGRSGVFEIVDQTFVFSVN
jgi:hypothetical protein